ncbi:tyrosine-type recombinase/integrase [Duganella sp. FT92W]|uniref:Tyrosine-type recombinase/integrase n=1 Tax=Pseudoduganella rivuli TaxID=2666085 RepID=A0A7X2IJC1_9BURK|nr:site-specific integrase [Pseudoduganella rivuli]MRV70612.1 tyrosine-type recombinase/integrase [Pseudoduganella rivuli]
MHTEKFDEAKDLFLSVLNGSTIKKTAACFGLAEIVVDKRIKSLARTLQSVVGVVGVDEWVTPTIPLLRQEKEAYLEALAHYVPPCNGSHQVGAVISSEQLNMLLRKIEEYSPQSNRDAALLLTLFATGARPIEIARLEIRDYLTECGNVREESVLRPEAAVNERSRPLYFCSSKANAAIDAYLAERVANSFGTTTDSAFRGLAADSRLFLSVDGGPLKIIAKTEKGQHQFLCREIHEIYRRIFNYAGVEGLTAMSARRAVATKLRARGAAMAEIGSLLGLSDPASIRHLLRRFDPQLKVAVRDLV